MGRTASSVPGAREASALEASNSRINSAGVILRQTIATAPREMAAVPRIQSDHQLFPKIKHNQQLSVTSAILYPRSLHSRGQRYSRVDSAARVAPTVYRETIRVEDPHLNGPPEWTLGCPAGGDGRREQFRSQEGGCWEAADFRFQATSREPNIGRFGVLLTGFRRVRNQIPGSSGIWNSETVSSDPPRRAKRQQNGNSLPFLAAYRGGGGRIV